MNKSTNVQKLSEFEDQPMMKLGAIRGFRYSPNANRLVDKLALAGRVSYASGLDSLYQVLVLGRI
ncbi:MAG: hypothetical protein H7293_15375 [Candidatus Saccharibacteria bacterium]|nr:hypothetical protein [Rhodoferax sp.]